MSRVLIFSILFFISNHAMAQDNKEKYLTVDAVIQELYNVISGPAGKRDWNRFRNLFHEDALMGNTGFNREGDRIAVFFTPEQYIEKNTPFLLKRAFYEEELGRKVNKFGGIAQVFSAYQFRFDSEDSEVIQRGVNSLQLIFEDGRWYISQLIFEPETPENKLPDSLAGTTE